MVFLPDINFYFIDCKKFLLLNWDLGQNKTLFLKSKMSNEKGNRRKAFFLLLPLIISNYATYMKLFCFIVIISNDQLIQKFNYPNQRSVRISLLHLNSFISFAFCT